MMCCPLHIPVVHNDNTTKRIPCKPFLMKLLFLTVLNVTLPFVPANAAMYTIPKLIDEDYYVMMRTDRSGAAVHDMLMAHAYIYMKQNEVIEHNTKIDMEEEKEGNAKKISTTTTTTLDHVDSITAQEVLQSSLSSKTYVVHGIPIDNKRRPPIHFGGICPRHIGPNFARTTELLRDLDLDRYALPIRCPSGSFTSYDAPYNPNSTVVFLYEVTYRQYDSHLFTNEWQLYLRSQIELATNQSKSVASSSSTTHPAITVVIHIRRGDVGPCKNPNRFLSDNHYIRILDEYVLKKNNPKDFEVIVYSESDNVFDKKGSNVTNSSSFTVFYERNYTVALDTPLNETWKAMMDSDVFILSKSSFSYVPALFNPNKVIYTPFWHEQPPNFNHWVTVSDDLVQMAEDDLHKMKENCS